MANVDLSASTFLTFVVLPLIATIAGSLLTLLGQSARQWWKRPRLNIEAGSTEPYVQKATNQTDNGETSTWVRIRVRNDGRSEALSARAYLVDLEKEGEQHPLFHRQAILLWASTGGDGDRDGPLTIPREFGRFFDITCCYGIGSGLRLPNSHLWGDKPFREPGAYLFTVCVSGANFRPKTAKVRVVYRGSSVPLEVSSVL
jgi:hypothetical protein